MRRSAALPNAAASAARVFAAERLSDAAAVARVRHADDAPIQHPRPRRLPLRGKGQGRRMSAPEGDQGLWGAAVAVALAIIGSFSKWISNKASKDELAAAIARFDE